MKTLIALSMIIFANTASADAYYLLDVNINGQIFKDLLVLDRSVEVQHRGPVTGTFTVPGAFTAPFEGRILHHWTPGGVVGTFEAVENGRRMNVTVMLHKNGDGKNLSGRIEILSEGATAPLVAETTALFLHEE